MKPLPIILAGGASQRFSPFNETNKTLFPLMGIPLVCHTVGAISRAGFKKMLLVRPNHDNDYESVVAPFIGGSSGVSFAVQQRPLGPGDAILSAARTVGDKRGAFLILNAHHVTADSIIPTMLDVFNKMHQSIVVVTRTKEPWRYGVVKMKGDKVTSVVEKPESGKEPSNLRIVGMYLLRREDIEAIAGFPNSDHQLEDGLDALAQRGHLYALPVDQELPTLKYAWDLLSLKDILLEKKQVLDKSAFIHKTALIEGPCWIGPRAVVGAFSIIRGGVILEEGAELQRYVDAKNVIVGKDTHIHSGTICDSVIGGECRIGAGFITANRRFDRGVIAPVVNGKNIRTNTSFLGAMIGHRVSIGIRIGTMPGTIIGDDATIWPGLIVKGNVARGTTLKEGLL